MLRGFLSATVWCMLLAVVSANAVRAADAAADASVWEMRVYYAAPGKLDALHARFRDHTTKLFAKHGMTNLIYWNLVEGSPEADRKLISLLAHDSVETAKASFDAFRQDPAWMAAREASEKKAGGSLTEAKEGVLSEYLVPTDYSTWR